MKRFNIVPFNEYERVILCPIMYFKKIEFKENQPSTQGQWYFLTYTTLMANLTTAYKFGL